MAVLSFNFTQNCFLIIWSAPWLFVHDVMNDTINSSCNTCEWCSMGAKIAVGILSRARWPDLGLNRCMAVFQEPSILPVLANPLHCAYANIFNNILYLLVIAVHHFIADIKSHRWRAMLSPQSQHPDRRYHKYSGDLAMILQDQVLGKEMKAWEKMLLKARLEIFCERSREILKEADVCFRGE